MYKFAMSVLNLYKEYPFCIVLDMSGASSIVLLIYAKVGLARLARSPCMYITYGVHCAKSSRELIELLPNLES